MNIRIIRENLLDMGHDPRKVDEWIECDHKFDLEAWSLNMNASPYVKEKEPNKRIAKKVIICRYCHMIEKEWNKAFVN